MVSLKTRRLAVPMVVACAGVFAGSTTAHAQSGGLSVTPAALEHTAKRGTVGSLTLNNTTKETLKVTVTVRPWRQELFGNVVIDTRTTLSKYVRATSTVLHDRRGRQASRVLQDAPRHRQRLALRRRRRRRQAHQHQGPQGHHPELPPDLEDPPQRAASKKQVPPAWPAAPRSAPASSSSRSATSATRSTRSPPPTRSPAPRGRSGTAKAIAALPGKLVGLNLGAARGMKKGRYTVTAKVTQAGRTVNASPRFTHPLAALSASREPVLREAEDRPALAVEDPVAMSVSRRAGAGCAGRRRSRSRACGPASGSRPRSPRRRTFTRGSATPASCSIARNADLVAAARAGAAVEVVARSRVRADRGGGGRWRGRSRPARRAG